MSKIEWTEKTWNPVTGCTKISEACENCYAEIAEEICEAVIPQILAIIDRHMATEKGKRLL